MPSNEHGRIWIDSEGDNLIRFKSSPSYREIRDTDGTDEEHSIKDSCEEIQVKPLFNFKPEISWPIRSFDLGGSAIHGYPKVANCARAMHHALLVAGHPCAVLVQLYESDEHGDKVRWQVEFKGQDNLGDALHVQAMRQWADSGAPLAFVAKLTGNPLESVRAIIKPSVDLGQWQEEPKIIQRPGGVWQ